MGGACLAANFGQYKADRAALRTFVTLAVY